MCVDDYQYRHYSARREKQCRRFVVVNQEDLARTYFVNISQFQENGHVALCKILIYLSTKGLQIINKKFYLPKFKAIIQPYSFCKISFEALQDKDIILKTYPEQKNQQEIFEENDDQNTEGEQEEAQENYYCRFQDVDQEQIQQLMKICAAKHSQSYQIQHNKIKEEHHETLMMDQSEQNNHKKCTCGKEQIKKTKECERGIREVIQAVKVWRQLHESKRCNLTNAAKIIGISKKSLDDYYLVLRIGQILGFDYENNMNGKMGDLRIYIRSKQQKITGKLGKTVKCFDLIPYIDLDKVMQEGRLFQS